MQTYVTPQQYLSKETHELEKHEYFEGKVTQMPSKTIDECGMIGNVFANIANQLDRKSYYIFLSGLRMYVEENTFFTYPDISIYSKPLVAYKDRDDVATNPIIIINILATHSLDFNYRKKCLLYHDISSLR